MRPIPSHLTWHQWDPKTLSSSLLSFYLLLDPLSLFSRLSLSFSSIALSYDLPHPTTFCIQLRNSTQTLSSRNHVSNFKPYLFLSLLSFSPCQHLLTSSHLVVDITFTHDPCHFYIILSHFFSFSIYHFHYI